MSGCNKNCKTLYKKPTNGQKNYSAGYRREISFENPDSSLMNRKWKMKKAIFVGRNNNLSNFGRVRTLYWRFQKQPQVKIICKSKHGMLVKPLYTPSAKTCISSLSRDGDPPEVVETKHGFYIMHFCLDSFGGNFRDSPLASVWYF